MIYITFYNCVLGEIILASDGKYLTGLWFKGQKHYPNIKNAEKNDNLEIFIKTKSWLDRYIKGENPAINEIATLLNGSEFCKKVWSELIKIPYGKTVTYADIAQKVQVKSYRAVGSAIGKNPISIIVPCHRVIGKNGKLTGYAAGIDTKRKLLNIEKIM